MAFQVLPVEESDVSEWTRIHIAAYSGSVENFLFETRPYSDETIEKFNRMRRNTLKEPEAKIMKSVEKDTGKIMGIAQWYIYDQERSMEDLIAAETRPTGIPEFHEKVGAFMDATFQTRIDTIGTRPHVLLGVLVVDPPYQRRGVGNVLMQWGVSKADELQLPAYLEASTEGLKLYERHGFEQVGEYEFDLALWGGKGAFKHWCMIREAKR